MQATEPVVNTVECPHCHQVMGVPPTGESGVVTCTNCQKPFRVDVSTPTPEPRNKLDVQVPPHVRQGAQAAAQPAVQPVAATQEGNEAVREAFASAPAAPPTPILTVNPNMFLRYPGRLLMYLALMGVGLYLLIDSIADQWLLKMLAGVGLIGWGAIRMGAWYFRNRSTTVSVTPRSIIILRGTMSTESTEIMLEDVQAVQAGQDFFGRIFNVGDVGIVTRGNLQNFLIRGVPDPERVVEAWRQVGGPDRHHHHDHDHTETPATTA